MTACVLGHDSCEVVHIDALASYMSGPMLAYQGLVPVNKVASHYTHCCTFVGQSDAIVDTKLLLLQPITCVYTDNPSPTGVNTGDSLQQQNFVSTMASHWPTYVQRRIMRYNLVTQDRAMIHLHWSIHGVKASVSVCTTTGN